jgi:hypothetical protein
MSKIEKVNLDNDPITSDVEKLMEKKIENFEIKVKDMEVLKEEIVYEINYGLFDDEKIANNSDKKNLKEES